MRDLIFGWENADVLVTKWVACCGCLDGDLLSWAEGTFSVVCGISQAVRC
jgi:hypothetical protein